MRKFTDYSLQKAAVTSVLIIKTLVYLLISHRHKSPVSPTKSTLQSQQSFVFAWNHCCTPFLHKLFRFIENITQSQWQHPKILWNQKVLRQNIKWKTTDYELTASNSSSQYDSLASKIKRPFLSILQMSR